MRLTSGVLLIAAALLVSVGPSLATQEAPRATGPLFDFGIGAGVTKPSFGGRADEVWRGIGSLDVAPGANVHFALGGESVRVAFELNAAMSGIGEYDARLLGGGLYLRWRARSELAGWRPELQGGYSRLYAQINNVHVSQLPEIYEGREIPANRQRSYPRIFGDGLGAGVTFLRPLTSFVSLGITARSDFYSLTQTFTNPDPSRGPLREPGRATSHSISAVVRWGR